MLKGQPVSEVLLGQKKDGFGEGKYTGFGGKVESGESIPQAAVREFAEETGILVSEDALVKVATLVFQFPYKPSWNQKVHVFTFCETEGTPAESREMNPKWFTIPEIPYDQMWDDARYWLPRVLAGKQLKADITFQRDNATVSRVIYYHWIFDSSATETHIV
jgi:8-oxo-dGTP diphosphatase